MLKSFAGSSGASGDMQRRLSRRGVVVSWCRGDFIDRVDMVTALPRWILVVQAQKTKEDLGCTMVQGFSFGGDRIGSAVPVG